MLGQQVADALHFIGLGHEFKLLDEDEAVRTDGSKLDQGSMEFTNGSALGRCNQWSQLITAGYYQFVPDGGLHVIGSNGCIFPRELQMVAN